MIYEISLVSIEETMDTREPAHLSTVFCWLIVQHAYAKKSLYVLSVVLKINYFELNSIGKEQMLRIFASQASFDHYSKS